MSPPVLAFLILAQNRMSKRIVADAPTAMADWVTLLDLEADTNTYNWTHYKAIACLLADRVTFLEKQLSKYQK